MPLVKASHAKEPSVGTLVAAVRETLDEYQANDIVCLDIAGRTAFADFMVIASGRSRMHVGALRDHLLRRLKELGAGRVQVEGGTRCDWVLIDGGGVWVNLFHPEIREFYNLEKLWSSEAPTD
ncbi:MAG: ribosome silencing factor [Hyphomicrobiales bacterium]|nr:ribosome silencing factor [Hyphomicrobiales bacterium]MCY4048370.1 ribosome silencing factor [Hyphomicrobiales bacterium]MCY4053920.1 ribosome silencing factor [Hyphomicrobiales bacterium]